VRVAFEDSHADWSTRELPKMDTVQPESAEQIHEILANQTNWDARSNWNWYGPMLARIALLVGKSEIKYVTGSVSDKEGSVSVFTRHRIIIGRISPADRENAEPEIWTIPRLEITKILDASRFAPARSSLTPTNPLAPPEICSVVAHYGNGLALILPATTSNPAARAQFSAFLPGLLADLDRVGPR
jgi:hypothetical protein